jgi:hypothetical protein
MNGNSNSNNNNNNNNNNFNNFNSNSSNPNINNNNNNHIFASNTITLEHEVQRGEGSEPEPDSQNSNESFQEIERDTPNQHNRSSEIANAKKTHNNLVFNLQLPKNNSQTESLKSSMENTKKSFEKVKSFTPRGITKYYAIRLFSNSYIHLNMFLPLSNEELMNSENLRRLISK